jgi:hypothetical protein
MYLLQDGFYPPHYFQGKAFVHRVIFTGGLLSSPSFSPAGFCPSCHFWMGELLSMRAFVLHSKLKVYIKIFEINAKIHIYISGTTEFEIEF